MITRPFFLHALSPLHAGTGQAVGHIDLPIARYRATGIPFLPGSSIKGVLRDALDPDRELSQAERRALRKQRDEAPEEKVELHRAMFGPATDEDPSDHAGAMVFGDARLLLLPVRSLRGTFAYATCPLLLRLAHDDLRGTLELPAPPQPAAQRAIVSEGSRLVAHERIFLEEIDLDATVAAENDAAAAWARRLADALFPEQPSTLTERLAIVDDETMTFLWETSTQVDARVRLDADTRTVADKALWWEESLPAESVLLSVCAATRPFRYTRDRRRTEAPEDLLSRCVGTARWDLQFGGKATVGRGRARLVPIGAA